MFLMRISGLPGRDGQSLSVGPLAPNPAQQERHPVRQHARDIQFPQQVMFNRVFNYSRSIVRKLILWPLPYGFFFSITGMDLLHRFLNVSCFIIVRYTVFC